MQKKINKFSQFFVCLLFTRRGRNRKFKLKKSIFLFCLLFEKFRICRVHKVGVGVCVCVLVCSMENCTAKTFPREEETLEIEAGERAVKELRARLHENHVKFSKYACAFACCLFFFATSSFPHGCVRQKGEKITDKYMNECQWTLTRRSRHICTFFIFLLCSVGKWGRNRGKIKENCYLIWVNGFFWMIFEIFCGFLQFFWENVGDFIEEKSIWIGKTDAHLRLSGELP